MNQYIITEEQIANIEEHGWIDAFHTLDQVRSHPYQSERDNVRFTEKELLHINTILTIHAIEHLPKECSCPECISIHKKIAELQQQAGEP